MRFAAALIASLVLSACASTQPDPAHGLTRITVEETACFGTCPIYELSVQAGGAYQLDARRFTRNDGMRRGQFDAGVFEAMADALIEADFFNLPADITPGSPACGMAPTDMPGLIVTARRGGDAHTVRYYHGCRAISLREMVDALHEAYGYDTLIAPERPARD